MKNEWLDAFANIDDKNWEIFVRRLAEINMSEHAKQHFNPEDLAYIRCAFKDYIIEYFLPLVEYLVKKDKKGLLRWKNK